MNRPRRRDFLATLAAGAAAGAWPLRARAAGAAPAAPARRPNILYLFTDQQTAGAMSCAGCADVRTPTLDALAAAGTRFDNAYCTYPLCSPSRASMFTGKMPHEIGVMGNVQILPEAGRQQEMGWLFRNAGYDTAYAGKWHLPKQLMEEGHGFDILCGMDDELVTEKCTAFLRQKRDQPFLLVGSFIEPHGICSVTRFADPRRKIQIGTLSDVDPYDPSFLGRCPALPPNFAAASPRPEAVTARHSEGMDEEYGRKNAPRPAFWAPEEEFNAAAKWPPECYRYYRFAYYRWVERVDAQIGQVLAALREAGIEDDTLVIFSSDHGEMGGAHGLNMKRYFYQEAVRIPLLVRFGNRVRSGQVVGAPLVSNGLDLLPTLCDYAGLAPPPGLRGLSLRPLLEGQAPPDWRKELVVECAKPDGRLLHTGRYKYMAYASGAHPEELFDLENDPGELRNLAEEASHAEELADCRRRLAAWRRENGDGPGT